MPVRAVRNRPIPASAPTAGHRGDPAQAAVQHPRPAGAGGFELGDGLLDQGVAAVIGLDLQQVTPRGR